MSALTAALTAGPTAGFAPTLLDPAQRRAVAADPTGGGGNLLRSALAVNPSPTAAFLHSIRPVVDAHGEVRHDFSLASSTS